MYNFYHCCKGSKRSNLKNHGCFRQDKQGGGRRDVRDSHGQEDLLPDGGLHRDDGGLDKGAAKCTKAERNEATAQQRGQQTNDTGMVDEGEERARKEVLVRPHWKNVPLL